MGRPRKYFTAEARRAARRVSVRDAVRRYARQQREPASPGPLECAVYLPHDPIDARDRPFVPGLIAFGLLRGA